MKKKVYLSFLFLKLQLLRQNNKFHSHLLLTSLQLEVMLLSARPHMKQEESQFFFGLFFLCLAVSLSFENLYQTKFLIGARGRT